MTLNRFRDILGVIRAAGCRIVGSYAKGEQRESSILEFYTPNLKPVLRALNRIKVQYESTDTLVQIGFKTEKEIPIKINIITTSQPSEEKTSITIMDVSFATY